MGPCLAKYLGHMIPADRVTVSDDRNKVIQQLKIVTRVEILRSVLRMVTFVR